MSFKRYTEEDRTAFRAAAIIDQAKRMDELKKRLPERSFAALSVVPPKFIGRLAKVLTGTKSKKMLIKAMCEQCVGWEHTIETIGNCSAHICAMHPYRPYRDADTK